MFPPFTNNEQMMSNEETKSTVTEPDVEIGETENSIMPESEPDSEAENAAETEPLSLEQIEDLKAKAAKADENWDRLLRLTADFDNFKKRSARERLDSIKFANESLISKLIPILDSFDMAVTAATGTQGDALESIKTGVEMIHGQLKGILTESGVEEVDATNKDFDPVWHEAVSQQESADVPEGKVLQQIRKGYKLKERLIRPASVVVAKQPA